MSVKSRQAKLRQSFERAYGLRCDRIDVVASGEHRVLARITDASGRSFVLKSRPPWITASDFKTGLALQEQAVERGTRIPAVVRTADIALVWQWDGTDFALHEWIEGVELGWSESHARALGAAVGAFSVSTAAMNATQAGDWAFPSGRRRWLPDEPEGIRSVARFLDEMEVPAATVSAIHEILERADVDTQNLPSGFIHGDVSPVNAIWDAGVATLIDLDEMRWGYPLFHAVQGNCDRGGLRPRTGWPGQFGPAGSSPGLARF